jgi:hypothetical protein
MNCENLSSDAETRGSGAIPGDEAGNPRHARCYTDAAQLIDVMQDQVWYLMSHGDDHCLTGCPDCARLEEVRRCLLRPFS